MCDVGYKGDACAFSACDAVNNCSGNGVRCDSRFFRLSHEFLFCSLSVCVTWCVCCVACVCVVRVRARVCVLPQANEGRSQSVLCCVLCVCVYVCMCVYLVCMCVLCVCVLRVYVLCVVVCMCVVYENVLCVRCVCQVCIASNVCLCNRGFDGVRCDLAARALSDVALCLTNSRWGGSR